jgi:hypothetical protein
VCIRFLDFHFPFNLFGVNIYDETGVMLVGYYAYDAAGGDSRPHLMLNSANNPKWFEFYTGQFETAWNMATPWEENPDTCSEQA